LIDRSANSVTGAYRPRASNADRAKTPDEQGIAADQHPRNVYVEESAVTSGHLEITIAGAPETT
jgi:hypothetical protein